MPKFTIERIENGPGQTVSNPIFFCHRHGTSVSTQRTPWVFEARCFYDAVVKMWVDRLTDSGHLPNVMVFMLHDPQNSTDVRIWKWGGYEKIRVVRVGN